MNEQQTTDGRSAPDSALTDVELGMMQTLDRASIATEAIVTTWMILADEGSDQDVMLRILADAASANKAIVGAISAVNETERKGVGEERKASRTGRHGSASEFIGL